MTLNSSSEFDIGGVVIGRNEDDQDTFKDTKPRILLTGRQRSGKTAINRVVFHKMSPNETLFLQSTSKIQKDSINHSSFVRFEVWEFPGQVDLLDASVIDSEKIFSQCHALIYIIDSQDDYADSLDIMRAVVTRAYSVNPNINFEIFIHKVDGLNDDHKIEIQRDIYHRAYDKLNQDDQSNITLSFSLTSIYDHSIFEAFSKVVQKLIPQLATLEQMLSIFVENSGIDKAFLFDVVSKIYIATDASAVDMQTYELCCDMIDVVIDLSGIYSNESLLEGMEGDSGSVNSGMFDHHHSNTPPSVVSASHTPNGGTAIPQTTVTSPSGSSPNMGMVQANNTDKLPGIDKAFLFDVVSKIYIATDASAVDMQTYELCCDMIDVVIDLSGAMVGSEGGILDDGSIGAGGGGGSYDNQSSSVIKLTNGSVMVLKEVNKYLALVYIMRDDHYNKAPLVDYNFICFRNGIERVFRVSNQQAVAAANRNKQFSKKNITSGNNKGKRLQTPSAQQQDREGSPVRGPNSPKGIPSSSPFTPSPSSSSNPMPIDSHTAYIN
ncbi:uncharacterized protein LOC142339231 isoform X2 [Convolutriloba macropyga]|uniref:uncharacterized protein LOC142339231 isoform X2 n=1 Tax=Convolutriloba macropyga TaxID=536237 RepID=UPI003F528B94